jgi:TfoX/Sxy family transcriptional regulator of competence genes
MAYNEVPAEKMKALLEEKPGFTMKKMFGGVGFLLHGNMACGVLNDDLIVRVGPQNYEKCLRFPEAREFDTSGQPMKGWVMVSFKGENKKQDLEIRVQRGVDFALGLPPKSK